MPRRDLLVRCHAVLFDSERGDRDRPSIRRASKRPSWPVPVLVAGGLDAENVGAVIRRLRPAGVDVASGVESAPGVKDRGRLRALLRGREGGRCVEAP